MQTLFYKPLNIHKSPFWRTKFFLRASVILLAAIVVISLIKPANAAVAYRSASSANNGGGTNSLIINTPAGATVGDVLIFSGDVRSSAGGIISADGTWTLINELTNGTIYKSTYYKVLTSTPPSSYTFPITDGLSSITAKASGGLIAYSGVDTSNPINAQAIQSYASSLTSTAPSITTTVPNAMIVALYGTATGTTSTQGSSMTERFDDASTSNGATSRTTSAGQDAVQAGAGASSTKTMTMAGAAVNIGHTLALRPASFYEQASYRWFNNQDISEPTNFIKTFGGSSQDKGYSVAQTSDGGYISTGDTFSFGAGNTDLVISKHDKAGDLEWTKTWGGTGGDLGYSVAQASDGGYVVTGQTGVLGAGGFDVVVLKFTSNGTLSWSRTWGGAGNDYGQSIVALADGSMVVTGWTSSYGAGVRDIILLKFNSSGTIVWDKTWGTVTEDYAEAVIETADGGFAVAGHTNGAGAGDFDQLLLKFDSTGALSWNRTWGGAGFDDSYGVTQLTDNGILVVGSTANYGAGGDDVSMVKYNSAGTLQWSRVWGGTGVEVANGVVGSADGGFAVTGQTTSFGAGADDFFALKYDSSGALTWNKTWGGTGVDVGYVARQTADSGFAFTGYTTNYGAGNWDSFIAKYDSSGTMDNCSSPMCQTPTATTSSPTVTTGNPSVTLATPGVASANPAITSPSAAYGSNFIAGKYTDVGSALAAQNTSATAPSGDTVFRLRMNLHVSGADASTGFDSFRLQYAAKGTGTCAAPSGGTPASYIDVTTSTRIAYANNPFTGDVTPLTTNANDPSHGADTIVRQSYEELNNLGIKSTIPIGQDGLWDFALRVDSSAPDNTNYCFRVIKSGDLVLNTYSVYPEITTPTRTISQSSYRFYQNADSVTPGTPFVAQDTAATIAPETPFRLRQRLAVDGRALSISGGSYKLQIAERSGVCDTGFSGEIYSDVLVSSSETKIAGSGSNIAGSGQIWQSANNITTDDGIETTATNKATIDWSDYLVSSNHGFSVPSNATITGIELIVDRQTSSGSNLRERTIRLVKAGVFESTDRARTSVNWDNLGGNWGGPSDLWGSSWTPADVNASNFGAAVSVGLNGTVPNSVANVDHMTIKVYYVTPGSSAVEYYNNSSAADATTISSTVNDPTNGVRPTVLQNYRETDPFMNAVESIPAGSDGLWDFVLTSNSASAGKTYCFRTVNSDGTPLTSYSAIPEVSFVSGPVVDPSKDMLRGGQSVIDGIKNLFSW